MDRVLPGDEEVFANFELNKELINEDFPTLERPQRTTVGKSCFGNSVRL